MIGVRSRIKQLLPYDLEGPHQPTKALLDTLKTFESDLQGELKMKQEVVPPASSSTPTPVAQPPVPNAAFSIFVKSRSTRILLRQVSRSSQRHMITPCLLMLPITLQPELST